MLRSVDSIHRRHLGNKIRSHNLSEFKLKSHYSFKFKQSLRCFTYFWGWISLIECSPVDRLMKKNQFTLFCFVTLYLLIKRQQRRRRNLIFHSFAVMRMRYYVVHNRRPFTTTAAAAAAIWFALFTKMMWSFSLSLPYKSLRFMSYLCFVSVEFFFACAAFGCGLRTLTLTTAIFDFNCTRASETI